MIINELIHPLQFQGRENAKHWSIRAAAILADGDVKMDWPVHILTSPS